MARGATGAAAALLLQLLLPLSLLRVARLLSLLQRRRRLPLVLLLLLGARRRNAALRGEGPLGGCDVAGCGPSMAEKDAESLTAHVMQSQPAAEKSPSGLPPKRDKREANSALSAEAWAHRHEAASVKLVNDRSASCTSSLLQPYSRPSVTDTTSARLFHGLKKPPTASNTSPALFSL